MTRVERVIRARDFNEIGQAYLDHFEHLGPVETFDCRVSADLISCAILGRFGGTEAYMAAIRCPAPYTWAITFDLGRPPAAFLTNMVTLDDVIAEARSKLRH